MRSSLVAMLASLALSPTVARAQSAAVKVTLASGPNAGSYSVTAPRPCVVETKPGKPRTLKAGVIDTALVANPKVVGAVSFEIPLLGAGPSKEIDIDVIFGPPDNVAADYYVSTIGDDKTGSGTVTVKESGANLSLSFSAVTDKGVKFTGTLECVKFQTKS